MKNKLLLSLGICAALMSATTSVYAASSPLIEFDGNSQNYFEFNTDPSELTDKFVGMMPGESRSETFTLVNNDYREMKFYLNTQVLKDLGDSTNTLGAVYEIEFSRDGEVFYSGTIGGENGSLVDLSGQTLGDTLLMASLEQGQSCEIEMSIGIDGDSMDNSYQNAIGQMQFVFSVQYDDPVVPEPTIVERLVTVPGEQIVRYIGAVATGDETNYTPLIIAATLSGVVVISLVVTKKKKKEVREGE